jgi:hypothetical protein
MPAQSSATSMPPNLHAARDTVTAVWLSAGRANTMSCANWCQHEEAHLDGPTCAASQALQIQAASNHAGVRRQSTVRSRRQEAVCPVIQSTQETHSFSCSRAWRKRSCTPADVLPHCALHCCLVADVSCHH